MDDNSQKLWFVMRVTYQREVAAKEKLDTLGLECFLPVRTFRKRGTDGRFCKVREPLIHNYIFIHSDKQTIDRLKTFTLPYLRYATSTIDGQKVIMTVPERQMKSFIAVAGNEEQRAVFLDPATIDLTKGDKVRITGGPFEGVEGTFMRLQGGRGKRVVVKIDSIAAVATTELQPHLVTKI
ncbi:MAG TPA: UpxY family transcription antiterminator [Candidatus Coprenecus stercoravium]|uniref:UpxY family transcription antiterminator n=1 Tax=Candidatus Coprenecus stercoravium TaxID=2840735 RepID=A0A9D2K8Z1_9BACT|nr:UpxY family transcription antiterminator [Candidatus Coprenecus stercoravium]